MTREQSGGGGDYEFPKQDPSAQFGTTNRSGSVFLNQSPAKTPLPSVRVNRHGSVSIGGGTPASPDDAVRRADAALARAAQLRALRKAEGARVAQAAREQARRDAEADAAAAAAQARARSSPQSSVRVNRHGSISIGGGSGGGYEQSAQRAAEASRAREAARARAQAEAEAARRADAEAASRARSTPQKPRSNVRVNRHGSISIGGGGGKPDAEAEAQKILAAEARAAAAVEAAAQARAAAAARAAAEAQRAANARAQAARRSTPQREGRANVRVNRHGSISIAPSALVASQEGPSPPREALPRSSPTRTTAPDVASSRSHRDRAGRLKRELNDAHDKHAAMSSALTQKAAAHKNASQQLSEGHNALHGAHNANEDLQRQLHRQHNAIVDANAKYADLAENIVQLQHDFECEFTGIDQERRARAAERDAVCDALAGTQQEHEALKDDIVAGERERLALLGAVVPKTDPRNLENIARAVHAAETELGELRNAVEDISEDLQKNSQRDEDVKRESAELADAIAVTKPRIAQARVDLGDREDTAIALANQLVAAQQRLDALSQEERALQTRNDALTLNIAKASQSLREAKLRSDQLIAELDEERKACAALEGDEMNFVSTIEGLADARKAVTEDLQRQRAELEVETRRASDLADQLVVAKRDNYAQQNAVNEARQQDAARENAIDELRTIAQRDEVRLNETHNSDA